MEKVEGDLVPLAVSYKTARRLIDCGNTKLHELLNKGDLKRTRIGNRPAVLYASLKALVDRGVAA